MVYYEIVVETSVDQKRFREFTGLNYKVLENGRTRIFGTFKDQAELFSILSRIRDLNLTLVSISRG